MQRPNIELHIEELVLRDMPIRDHARLGAAVERELARLFAEGSASAQLMKGIELGSVSLPSIRMQQGASPDAVGMQVAQALYKGLGQGSIGNGASAGHGTGGQKQ